MCTGRHERAGDRFPSGGATGGGSRWFAADRRGRGVPVGVDRPEQLPVTAAGAGVRLRRAGLGQPLGPRGAIPAFPAHLQRAPPSRFTPTSCSPPSAATPAPSGCRERGGGQPHHRGCQGVMRTAPTAVYHSAPGRYGPLPADQRTGPRDARRHATDRRDRLYRLAAIINFVKRIPGVHEGDPLSGFYGALSR